MDDAIDVIGLVLGMRMEGADTHKQLVDRLAELAATSPQAAPGPVLHLEQPDRSLARLRRAKGLPLVEDLERGLRAVRHLVDYAASRSVPTAGPRCRRRQHATLPAGRVLTEAASKKILGQAGLPVTLRGPGATPLRPRAWPARSMAGWRSRSSRAIYRTNPTSAACISAPRPPRPKATPHGCSTTPERLPGCADRRRAGSGNGGGRRRVHSRHDLRRPIRPADRSGRRRRHGRDFQGRGGSLPPLSRGRRRHDGRPQGSKLLDGFRGAPGLDRDALIDCCVRFAEFVAATDGQYRGDRPQPGIRPRQGKGVRIADALIITRIDEEES